MISQFRILGRFGPLQRPCLGLARQGQRAPPPVWALPNIRTGTRHNSNYHYNYNPQTQPSGRPSPFDQGFWSDGYTWRRAGIHSFRCMFAVTAVALGLIAQGLPRVTEVEPERRTLKAQAEAAGLNANVVTATLASPFILQAVLLAYGRDRVPGTKALTTGVGMIFLSVCGGGLMAGQLLKGREDEKQAQAWRVGLKELILLFGSMVLAPLPFAYWRLRIWGVPVGLRRNGGVELVNFLFPAIILTLIDMVHKEKRK